MVKLKLHLHIAIFRLMLYFQFIFKCVVTLFIVVMCIQVYKSREDILSSLTNFQNDLVSSYKVDNQRLLDNNAKEALPYTTTTNFQAEENDLKCDLKEKEKKYVYFLKAHKTGSTTARNILQRFVMKRNLTTPVFFRQHTYPSRSLTKYLRPLPTYWKVYQELKAKGEQLNQSMIAYLKQLPEEVMIKDNQCNILACHTVFVKEEALKIFPSDVTFVATLRHPLQQMISAYGQWNLPKRFKIPPGVDPAEEFLRSPEKYDKILPASLYNPIARIEKLTLSFTKNYIAYEYGFDLERAEYDEKYVQEYLAELNNTFKAVIFTDRFTESLVLLKRELSWSFQDILFIHLRRNKHSNRDKQYDEKLLQNHRNWTFLDYAIYDMFRERHENTVKNGGKIFQKELTAFESILEEVTDFCMDEVAPLIRRSNEEALKNVAKMTRTIGKTEFSCEFEVEGSDCVLMSLNENVMWVAARVQRYPQLCDLDFRNFVNMFQIQGSSTPFCIDPEDVMKYNIGYKKMKGAFWMT